MAQKIYFLLAGLLLGLLMMWLGTSVFSEDADPALDEDGNPNLMPYHIGTSERLFGLSFDEAERDSMLNGVRSNRAAYDFIRETPIPNEVWPSVQFNPLPQGYELPHADSDNMMTSRWNLPAPGEISLPAEEDMQDLAFYSIGELSSLIRSRQISSEQLTRLFLERIRTYDPELKAVITLTEELALEQARRADALLEEGIWLGPLHGIPYGTKDLLALEGYPTTWGAAPFKEQTINETATVINRLEEAGSVHLAKLTLGALAWGDVWFGGTTKTPWDTEIGASGSSAGPASATAAGLVPFAIGSETLGSIVSPATRNGVTGLRPTYGRVSRHGAMALSWSMDKLGPLTRSAEDAAIVFDVIHGDDGLDPSLYENIPFSYDAAMASAEAFEGMRIGYEAGNFEQEYPGREHDLRTLEVLREMGVELIAFELPELELNIFNLVLSVEAAAAFDQLTVSGEDDLMVRQIQNAWPNVFRTSQLVPAVAYIQANRVRTQLIEAMHQQLNEAGVDMYITPSFASNNLQITNLTGHPTVVLPNGFDVDGMPVSITFSGRLFSEAALLQMAAAYQQRSDFHQQHPEGF